MSYQQGINIRELKKRCRLLHEAANALDWLHEAGVVPTDFFIRANTELWNVRKFGEELLSELQHEEGLS